MRRLAASALLLASCSSSVTTRVDVADDSAVMFFVIFDDDDRVTRVTEAFGVREGAIVFGSRPVLELIDGDASVVRVRMTEEALEAAAPGYDPARAEVITVRAARPPEVPERTTTTSLVDGTVFMALPSGAGFDAVVLGEDVLEPLDPSGSRASVARARLTIEVPVDFEHCRNPAGRSLTPFGARAAILDEIRPRPTSPIRGLGRIDADTYVALISSGLFVVRRGEQASPVAFDPNVPSTRVPTRAMFPAGRDGRLTSIAVDPGASADGSRRVLVTGFYEPPDAPEDHTGYLFELAFADGGLSRIRTATVVAQAESRAVAFDAAGNFAAMYDLGKVFMGTRDSDALRFAPIPTTTGPPDVGRHIVSTNEAARPWLAGTRGRLHFYDIAADKWDSTILMSSLQDSLHFSGLGVSASTPREYWAIGSRNPMFRFVNDGWEQFELTMPPRHRVCSPGGDPNTPAIGESFESMAMGRDYAWTTNEGCTQLLEIRLSDRCVAIREIEGEMPQKLEDYIERLLVFDGELFAGAEGGVLLSAPIR